MELLGRKATVMGLGRHGGGVAAARWLARQGAVVTVTDVLDEHVLADSIAELKETSIGTWRLGEHCPDDFTSADLLVVNPAVRPDNRFVALAREVDVPIISEIELFLSRCSANVIGVTGSNGKSTTAAMIAAILEAAGRRTWFGGNIGRSLLADLSAITADDWVVLELSSFQLHWLGDEAPWPHFAVVTNCTSNHLDWHGTFDRYAVAKQRLLINQSCHGTALLNSGDPIVRSWQRLVRGRLILIDDDGDVPPLAVPGQHQRRNASCAAGVARAAGCSVEAIHRGLQTYRGLPHRLQFVAEVDGRLFYNDSMATTPESVMAAVAAFREGAWFLVGGYDKGFDYTAMCAELARAARGVACYGAAREKISALLARSPARRCHLSSFVTLDEAFAWCCARARPREAIVLSPACASYDQFRDYRHRGETFIALVRALVEGGAHAR